MNFDQAKQEAARAAAAARAAPDSRSRQREAIAAAWEAADADPNRRHWTAEEVGKSSPAWYGR